MKRRSGIAALFFVKVPLFSIEQANRSRRLCVWGTAFLVATLLLAGCERSLADLFGLGTPDGGAEKPGSDTGYTVTYAVGNGDGTAFTKMYDGGGIDLPDSGTLTSPAGYAGMVFAGWHDGTFTYDADYTVTDNVTLEARWGFTTLAEVKKYLSDEAGATNTLLVVCNGSDPALTFDGLISAIGSQSIDLDLSASTLSLTDNTFTMPKSQTIKKLILPRTAKTVTKSQDSGISAEVVSGLNIASISGSAFSGYTALTEVNFPQVTEIAMAVFRGCDALKTASFPEAVKINAHAFVDCSALVTADFPNATAIDANAFSGCIALKIADFPYVTGIGGYAFSGCTALTTITVGGGATISPAAQIHSGFNAFYDAGQAAGIYTFVDGNWTFAQGAGTAR